MPIEEYLAYDHAIYPASTSSTFFRTASQLNSTQPKASVTAIGTIEVSEHTELRKPLTNAVTALSIETAAAGYGALIFCGGRLACQATASLISEAMPLELSHDILDRRKEVLSDLRSLPVGLDETLEKTVIRGVGYYRKSQVYHRNHIAYTNV